MALFDWSLKCHHNTMTALVGFNAFPAYSVLCLFAPVTSVSIGQNIFFLYLWKCEIVYTVSRMMLFWNWFLCLGFTLMLCFFSKGACDVWSQVLWIERTLIGQFNSKLFSSEIFNYEHFVMFASQVGAGAVLLQVWESVDGPVCYMSKKYNNYSTTENEALALLIWALKHFGLYVSSGITPVVIYTDHDPLTLLCSLSFQDRVLLRWSMFLQSKAFDIRHIKCTQRCSRCSLTCPGWIM